MVKNQYLYETRCKRCGKRTEWYFGNAEHMERETFIKGMTEKITYPLLYNCGKCKMETVQDIVSYRIFGE